MEKIVKSKQKLASGGGMTLLGYYNTLPPRTFPKTEFVEMVAERCGADPMTVRNWIAGRNRPKREDQVQVLVQMTGIPADQLWQE